MKMYSKFSLHRLEGKHPGNFYIVDLPLPQFAPTLAHTHTHTYREKNNNNNNKDTADFCKGES